MTVIATALKHMLAAGMPHEAIVAAVMEMEAGMVAHAPVKQRSKAALRQERYEQRKRQQASETVRTDADLTENDAQTSDLTVSDAATPSPAPSLFLPPDPQPKPTPTHTPATETRARKGTRLAEDWEPEQLSDKHGAMVAKWPPGAFIREREKFRNYWLSKSGAGATKTDWQRTWINWLLQADERMPNHGTGNRHQSGAGGHGGQFRDPVFDYLAESHGS